MHLRRLLMLALLLSTPVRAQVALPGLPTLPVQVPDIGVARTVQGVRRAADGALADVRRLRVETLLRRERRAVDTDPRGEPVRRGEVIASDPDPAALTHALAAGFRSVRDRTDEGLGLRIVVLQAPPGWSTRRALRWLVERDPGGTYEYNHLYFESGGMPPTTEAGSPPATAATVVVGRAGLIDGGVDATHPALGGIAIDRFGCDGRVVPSAHGTAVGSLLVGRAGAFAGAHPGAHLFAADVYCGERVGGAADTIVAALGWLVSERVGVINISLVGPSNRLLENAIARVQARAQIVVAAVGNDGPASPPLYPAAYPGVIAVTAVDARGRVLPEACRGPHVMFAAPGAALAAADAGGGFGAVRGTSFAAPLVAGLLAAELERGASPAAAIASLAARAQDLGAPGRDAVYGIGLIGADLRHDPDALRATLGASAPR